MRLETGSLLSRSLFLSVFFALESVAKPLPGLIDNDPAPSPEDGPPGARGAVRDPALLWPEIGAIAGSYFTLVTIICIALLSVANRRRRFLAPLGYTDKPAPAVPPKKIPYISHPSLHSVTPMTMSPHLQSPDAGSMKSPKLLSRFRTSVRSANGSTTTLQKHKRTDSYQSSVVTYDPDVIEETKARGEIEMDRLYAAVAEHENEKERSRVSISEERQYRMEPPPPPPVPPLPAHPQFVPELQHLRNAHISLPHRPNQQMDAEAYSVRANTTSPRYQTTPRANTASPRTGKRPTPIMVSPPPRTSSHDNPASPNFSRKRQGSTGSASMASPGLPMGSAALSPDREYYGDCEPLTPKPPKTPIRDVLASPVPEDMSKKYHFTQAIRSSRTTPPVQTPLSARFPQSPGLQSPGLPANPRATPPNMAQTPRSAVFPQSPPPPTIVEHEPTPPGSRHQQRQPTQAELGGFNFNLQPSGGRAMMLNGMAPTPTLGAFPADALRPQNNSSPAGGKKNKPTPLNLSNANGEAGPSKQSGGVRNSLPLRSLLSPTSALKSPKIKNTEVTRPEIKRLQGPGSAVPATPYSPYMPFTPLTPMTPSRLVTREERKRNKKMQGKTMLTQEDIVPEEDDMWY